MHRTGCCSARTITLGLVVLVVLVVLVAPLPFVRAGHDPLISAAPVTPVR